MIRRISPPDYPALIVDDSDAVRIAVEGDSQVGPILFHRGDQVLQVLLNRRVRMVIGKGPVALAEQAARLDAKLREKLWRHQRPSSVSAIEYHLEIARELPNATRDVVDVAVDHLLFPKRSLPSRKFPRDGKVVQVLNVGAKNRGGSQPQLETVVLARIVGSRDLDSANDVQVMLRPIRERRRDNSDIDDINAASQEPGNQRRV